VHRVSGLQPAPAGAMTVQHCPPPDPAPRTPQLRLPRLACDTVCHVIGPRDRFAFSPDRKYDVPDAPFEELWRLHKILGIDRAVLVQATVHGSDNSAMVNALERSDGAYRGVAIVDDTVSETEIERLHRAGVCGVRFNFVRMLGGPPEPAVFDRIVDRIAPFGWHVALHVGGDDLIEHAARLRRLQVPAVVEHLGRVDIAQGLDQQPFRLMLDLAKSDGIWIKIDMGDRLSVAGPPYRDVVPFVHAIMDNCAERVLWGTDWPHPMYQPDKPMPNDGDLVDLLAAYLPDPAQREAVLVKNPAAFYSFDD
jgi:2-pyrone-4,6-dicarboxylate lactonase